MITFRFHIVSITAVFLAIAIGVVVGTTYLDGAVVDGLRNRIDSVEQNLDDRKAENDRLDAALGLATSYIDASAPYAVTDRLTDVPVLVVATTGVDEAAVEGMVSLTRVAGGTTPGIVWLETPWELESDDDREALADIVDGEPDAEVEDLRADAWTAIAHELTTASTDGSVTEPTSTEVIDALLEAGFLSVDALGDDSTTLADLAGAQPRVLVVTGARAEPGPASAVPSIVEAAADRELITVVADVHVTAPEAPGRGEELLGSLSPELLEVVAIVDNADRTEGQVASVLALAAGANGPVGHLGYGDGADGVLPAWTPP